MDPRHPHALYRFFDATGRLLYIGITFNLASRFPSHSDDKPWWSQVDTIRVEGYADRSAVLAAEKAAIKAERPLYNVAHQVLPPLARPAAKSSAPRPLARTLAELRAQCHTAASRTRAARYGDDLVIPEVNEP